MDSSIGFEISETARLVRRAFDRRAGALGATPTQWRMLVRLVRMGDGARQIALAEALDVEPITLCRMVDRLEASGLVERRRDEADRRAWRIHLTDKARPVIAELQALGEAFHAELLDGIDAAGQALLRDLLARIRGNLDNLDTHDRDAATAKRKTT